MEKRQKIEQYFDDWIEVKKELHFSNSIPEVKEGEIWRCGWGENVGTEIFGKGPSFTRPAIIIKKYSKWSVRALPLTSKKHGGSWYRFFVFRGVNEYAILNQDRPICTTRLYEKMGELPEKEFNDIKKAWMSLNIE